MEPSISQPLKSLEILTAYEMSWLQNRRIREWLSLDGTPGDHPAQPILLRQRHMEPAAQDFSNSFSVPQLTVYGEGVEKVRRETILFLHLKAS